SPLQATSHFRSGANPMLIGRPTIGARTAPRAATRESPSPTNATAGSCLPSLPLLDPYMATSPLSVSLIGATAHGVNPERNSSVVSAPSLPEKACEPTTTRAPSVEL